MAGERIKTLARQIFSDILSFGSAVSAGPVWSAHQEAEVMEAVEVRLQNLLQRHGHETDEEIAARFRREHPDLFQGGPEERHSAARGGGGGSGGDAGGGAGAGGDAGTGGDAGGGGSGGSDRGRGDGGIAGGGTS